MRQVTIFSFNELSAQAQQKAISAEQRLAGELFVFDTNDLKKICEWVGIRNPEFSRLSFKGEYFYATQALAKIKAFASQNSELHNIVAVLQELQKQNAYRLTANITCDTYCRYSHENSVNIQVFKSGVEFENVEFENCFRDLMRYFYKLVESEYVYQTSAECAREYLNDSDNEYTAAGNLWS